MPFELKQDYALLDGNEFVTHKETENGGYYFADRIATRGILNFGLVKKGEEALLDLSENDIQSPIIIDSIVAFSATTEADEVYFNLYKRNAGTLEKVGMQRYSNAQMPIDYPDGIVYPEMVIGVAPARADTTVVLYTKPVQVLFEATTNIIRLQNGDLIQAENGLPADG